MADGQSRPQVVILSSIEWGAAWQRHQIFATQWAKTGYDVFFVENTYFRDVKWSDIPRLRQKLLNLLFGRRASRRFALPEGLVVINPLVVPPTGRLFQRLNSFWCVPRLAEQLRARGLRSGALIVAYLPTPTTLRLLDRLEPSKVIYDCVDNFHGLPWAPSDLARTESALLERSALVVTTSPTLHEDKAKLHDNVVELHQGVPRDFFIDQPIRSSYRKLCYYGTLWSAIDYEPIKALANAGFEVTLIGPQKEPLPVLPPSVQVEPALPYERLPMALRRFDALLLPYRSRSEYNRGVVPAKLYECLATGCPIIASPLPSLKRLDDVLYVAHEPAEWPAIAARLPETETESRRAQRMRYAATEEHAAVFSKLRSAIDSAPANRWRVERAGARAEELARGLASIGMFYGLARAATVLTQVLAGRWLGPYEYGRANLVIAAAAYLQILPIMGFPVAMSKFVSSAEEQSERDELIATTLTAFFIWAGVAFGFSFGFREALARRIGMPPSLLSDALIFAFATAFYTVVSSPLLGLKRFGQRGRSEAVYGFSAPLVLLALFYYGVNDYRALITALSLSLGIGSIYSLWVLRARLRPAASHAALRVIVEYAAVAALNLLSTACILGPARLFLNHYDSSFAVGLFSAYFTATVQIALALGTMATAVVIPLASDNSGQTEAWAAFRRLIIPVALSSWLIFFLASAGAMQVFGHRYPFKPEWSALFSLAAALILIHGLASALFAARDRRGLYASAIASSVAGAANIGLARWLIPDWGVTGAAIALIASYIVGFAPYAPAIAAARRRRPARQNSYN